MCSTKIGHFLKQYLPNKSHKWGYKLSVLCNLSEYAYLQRSQRKNKAKNRFEVYSGQGDKRDIPVDDPDLGPTSNVVLRLVKVISHMKNHIVFFDNFCTSLPLSYFVYIVLERFNKIDCPIADKKDLKKELRTMMECIFQRRYGKITRW